MLGAVLRWPHGAQPWTVLLLLGNGLRQVLLTCLTDVAPGGFLPSQASQKTPRSFIHHPREPLNPWVRSTAVTAHSHRRNAGFNEPVRLWQKMLAEWQKLLFSFLFWKLYCQYIRYTAIQSYKYEQWSRNIAIFQWTSDLKGYVIVQSRLVCEFVSYCLLALPLFRGRDGRLTYTDGDTHTRTDTTSRTFSPCVFVFANLI